MEIHVQSFISSYREKPRRLRHPKKKISTYEYWAPDYSSDSRACIYTFINVSFNNQLLIHVQLLKVYLFLESWFTRKVKVK